jgi:predicted pyridoxine 5'-phosphate oxidase superfamily flavin-nucleotide-binding protein
MAVLTEDMIRVVREQRLGFVATVCPDGSPNLSPKGTTDVWDDDHLVFVDLASPQTVANLRGNPACEVNVVDQVARKGYRFKGRATVLAEGPLYDEVVAWYAAKPHLRDFAPRARHVVLVRVERALPLLSPAYELGLSEEEVAAGWRAYWQELEAARVPP